MDLYEGSHKIPPHKFLKQALAYSMQLKKANEKRRRLRMPAWPPPILRTDVKDGGYGWIAILASFLAHTVVWGILWTIGIWTQEFQKAFETESVGYVSFIGSGINAVNYISGE